LGGEDKKFLRFAVKVTGIKFKYRREREIARERMWVDECVRVG
jgi:hypothetical protein